MDILKMGAQIFAGAIGDGKSGLDLSAVQSALGNVLGEGEELNLGSLASSMQSGGLGSVLESWLGDGANQNISTQQLGRALGDDNIADFASRLNIDVDSARQGLSRTLPGVIDKASSGGSLLDAVGGVDGVIGMVNKLFK